MTNKKCPNCNAELKEIKVNIQGASQKALSYQCSNCDYFEFEQTSSRKIILEKSNLKKMFGTIKRDISGQEFKDIVKIGWYD